MFSLIQLMLKRVRINRKFEKKMVRKETRAYEAKLQEELNQDRIDHGKKPFPPDKFEKEEMKEIKESTTDPWTNFPASIRKSSYILEGQAL